MVSFSMCLMTASGSNLNGGIVVLTSSTFSSAFVFKAPCFCSLSLALLIAAYSGSFSRGSLPFAIVIVIDAAAAAVCLSPLMPCVIFIEESSPLFLSSMSVIVFR